jgi:hypothetical protein
MTIKTILAVSLMAASSMASAATFTFSGNIANHNDVIRVDFNLAADATNVRVWTDSFLATGPTQTGPGTNFDPITALWNADTGALIAQNDDNASIATGQTYFDSGFSLASLTAGNYFFTMATYNNWANGTTGSLSPVAGVVYSNGFNFDNQTPIAIADWNQPANSGNARGTFWRINLDGVDGATGPQNPNAVPVPGAVWLFGSAIAGFFGFGRRKQA